MAVEILAFFCLLALYAPWFVLIAVYLQRPAFLWLYGRLAGLAVIAWAVAYRLQHRLGRAAERERRRTTQILTVAGLFMAALCIMAPEIRAVSSPFYLAIYLFAGFWAWICGSGKAVELHTSHQLQKQLLSGTLSYAACFLLASFLDISPQFDLQVLPFLIFWLPAAMVVTGILRVSELQDTENTAHLRSWLRPLFAISAACLLGAIFFGFLGPPALRVILIPLKYLWQAVRYLLFVVSYAAAYVLSYFLAWLSGFFVNRAFKYDLPELPEFTEHEVAENQKAFLSPELLRLLQWAVLIFAVLVLLRVAYHYLLQRRRLAADKREGAEKESFFSQQALMDWGRRQLQNVASKFRQRADALALRRRDRTAVEIYHTLLALAARRGIVRPPATTAHAFQPNLQQACPDCWQEADNIFHAFVRELYAEEKTEAKELDMLRENLAAIKKNM